jgi:UDPglucose--hexose-1-phosphate uridylyltransferase
VLVAPSRADRPHDVGPRASGDGACPFCPGNEAETPPEVLAERPGGGPADGPGWRVRAFANKFPALPPEEGAHEVVVNTPRHVARFADLTAEEAARAAGAWASRLAAIADDPRRLWPFLFLNQGAESGASLEHTHAQLVGLPFAPPHLVARERAFAEAGRCPVCAEIARAGERLVAEDEGLVAYVPEVPPLSGTVRIAPADHAPAWGPLTDAGAIGRHVRRLVIRLGAAFDAPAANLWLHQRSPGGTDRYHWHLDAVPRLGTLAGLELGAGVVAAAHEPEAVAARVREQPDPGDGL